MIASEVRDFPEPDSPTKPRTSPAAMENERSRTAWSEDVEDREDAEDIDVDVGVDVDVETAALGCPAVPTAEVFSREGNSIFRFRTSSSAPTSS